MSELDNQRVLLSLLDQVQEDPEGIFTDTGLQPVLEKGEEVLDLDESFDFEGFQVVRREFFAHQSEPSATFNNCKFYVNSACLTKFPTVQYVQVLVNRDSKIMALRPCQEQERDSFLWCGVSKGKRKPKQITCKLFYAKIVSMMDWNPNYRYKMLGKLIHANGEYLLAFDLTATEVYQREIVEGKKPKNARTPVFPAEWQNQFGMPFMEHRKSMQISTFDGYAIYAIKEKANASATVDSQVAFEQVHMSEV